MVLPSDTSPAKSLANTRALASAAVTSPKFSTEYIGCDNILNGARNDNCGVCGGDNSECVQDCLGEWGGMNQLDDYGRCCESFPEGCNSCECASNNNMLLPNQFEISNAYPNPFNPMVNFNIDIPRVSDVQINIYNLLGEKIDTIYGEKVKYYPGRHQFSWNASQFNSGIYFVRFKYGANFYVRKITLIK